MPDLAFYTYLIISQIWLSAAWCANSKTGEKTCVILGFVWMFMAVLGKIFV